MLKAPDTLNELLQGDFTDYVTEDGEKYHIGSIIEYPRRFNLVYRFIEIYLITRTELRTFSNDALLAPR